MTTTRFEDLRVWQEAIDLATQTYNAFHLSKKFWLTDQILRSAISIPSNIAEGHDRVTAKEYFRFLSIARGSCSELRTQLMIAQEIDAVGLAQGKNLIASSRKITAMLNKQMAYLKKK